MQPLIAFFRPQDYGMHFTSPPSAGWRGINYNRRLLFDELLFFCIDEEVKFRTEHLLRDFEYRGIRTFDGFREAVQKRLGHRSHTGPGDDPLWGEAAWSLVKMAMSNYVFDQCISLPLLAPQRDACECAFEEGRDDVQFDAMYYLPMYIFKSPLEQYNYTLLHEGVDPLQYGEEGLRQTAKCLKREIAHRERCDALEDEGWLFHVDPDTQDLITQTCDDAQWRRWQKSRGLDQASPEVKTLELEWVF